MIRSHRDAPLREAIRHQSKEVWRFLAAEARRAPKEQWKDPFRRVAEKAGVAVTLVEQFVELLSDRPPNGHLLVETALREPWYFIDVTEPGKWRATFGHWRPRFLSDDKEVRAAIWGKIDAVVSLLRAEAGRESTEHWTRPCEHAAAQVRVQVSLVDDLSGWSSAPPPCKNSHLAAAVGSSFVVVAELGDWRVAFKLRDWESLDDDSGRGGRTARPDAETLRDRECGAEAGVPTKAEASAAHVQTEIGTAGTRGTDQPEAHSISPAHAKGPEYNEEFLIREFDRRERDRGPIFAGFIVNDLLPRMGFDSSEAKRVLRAMTARDIVRTTTKPNPNHPGRTTTFVTLNRENTLVKAALGSTNGTTRGFEPVPIRGEPLSVTILRERR